MTPLAIEEIRRRKGTLALGLSDRVSSCYKENEFCPFWRLVGVLSLQLWNFLSGAFRAAKSTGSRDSRSGEIH